MDIPELAEAITEHIFAVGKANYHEAVGRIEFRSKPRPDNSGTLSDRAREIPMGGLAKLSFKDSIEEALQTHLGVDPKVKVPMPEVTLTPISNFEVHNKNGESLGIFEKKGEWQGMVHLQQVDDPYDVLVVSHTVDKSPFCDMLGKLVGDEDKPVSMRVIKASPSILSEV